MSDYERERMIASIIMATGWSPVFLHKYSDEQLAMVYEERVARHGKI